MKAIIIICLIAILVLAVILDLRTKQVKSLSSELEKRSSAAFDAQMDLDLLKVRVVEISADKPQRVTNQYLAMKLSGKLGQYVEVLGDKCYLKVIRPLTPAEIEQEEDRDEDADVL